MSSTFLLVCLPGCCYDDDRLTAEYEDDTLVRKFIYGPGIDEPVRMIDADGQNETKYHYHCDGSGSVIALLDENGNATQKYKYDAFGKPTIKDANDR